ncbi:DUF354 domain-containing protein [Halorussus amylolyticus]|uniref:DUF354 domain-containing protein n=1 Tax=Halorussus amylolyticus TaxID=1126242 RepID=UPI0010527F0D|nr:DUF354 domain-containing protein [Halorussus amylolyticus]
MTVEPTESVEPTDSAAGRADRADPPTVTFTVTHPHDAHLFRHAIAELSAAGYRIYVFAREKEMAVELLKAYDIPHMVLSGDHTSKGGLIKSWLTFEYNLLRQVRALDPDLMVAEVGVATSQVSAILGVDSLVFVDAEHATLQNRLAFPFADRICTSRCFWDEIGSKQVRYDGYQELAYLHPDRFDPDPAVLDEAGLSEDDTFVVLRAVGWNAAHDIGGSGFDGLEAVVSDLESTGAEVVITSEEPLPDHLEPYRVSVASHRMHDLMYYADLYVGESPTMATESAVLGTPAIYVSTIRMGYTEDIEERYGLLFNYSGEDRQMRALSKAKAILTDSDPEEWAEKRRRLLADNRDTTDVIVEQVREMVGDTRGDDS